MRIEDQLMIGRNILCNAINMNLSKETIIKISQKVDEYIIEYHFYNKKNTKQSDEKKNSHI